MATNTPKKRTRVSKAPIEQTPIEQAPITEDVAVSEFIIELSVGGTTITSSGLTPQEALHNLERPLKIITKGVVTVRHGERVKTILMMPLALKRMFYPLAEVTIAKMLGMNM